MMEESAQYSQYLLQHYPIYTDPTLMQSFSAVMVNAAYNNPQKIEYMVELEMARIKENWSRSEEQYVEQLVLENPITVERRKPNNIQEQHKQEDSVSDGEVIDVVSVSTELEKDPKQQRAEACRRSRHTNKIKKAKMKYRHRYMSLKLQSSTQLFNHILDVVAQAESHLLSRGFTRASLQHLRNGFRVDAAIDNIRNLDHTMEM